MHNWPVIAYVPGSILLGGLLSGWLAEGSGADRNQFRMARMSVIVAVVFSALLVDLARFPQWASLLNDPKRLGGSSIIAVWGWDGLANAIRSVQQRHAFADTCRVLFVKDRNDAALGYFHVAGEMAFALKNADRIRLEPVPHQKQYNLWPSTDLDHPGDVCMVVAGPSREADFPQSLHKAYLGKLSLAKEHTITLPDTRSSYYAIYVKQAGQPG